MEIPIRFVFLLPQAQHAVTCHSKARGESSNVYFSGATLLC
jgi:hypothetical protein